MKFLQRSYSFCALVFVVSFLSSLSTSAQSPVISNWVFNTTGATGYKGYASNIQSLSYTNTDVYVSCTCIPGYDIGPWQSNPNIPVQENFVFKITRNPQKNNGTPTATGLGHTGVWSNGVSIFNAKDGMSYNNQGVWNRDALYWEGISFDNCLGHPAPNGEYHHHVNPTCLYDDKDSTHHSPIIGWSFDGYPIYGAYGFANSDGSGGIRRMRSSFVKSTATTRANGPAVSTQYPLGCFIEDFSYVSGSGDLDDHNGRFCVTPEYPAGTYAYFVTIDESRKPVYPYTPGPTYYGVVQPGNTGPGGGHNTIPGTATKYTPSTNTPTIALTSASGTTICSGVVVSINSSISHGGDAPKYQWYKNGTAVGTNSAVYVDSSLKNKDSVWCVLTSNESGVSTNTVTSARLVFTVNPILKPEITIDSPANLEFCEGATLSLTAKATNGGTVPRYTWLLNGKNVGSDKSLIITSLKQGDSLYVLLQSTALCASPTEVRSAALNFTAHPLPAVPDITRSGDELKSSTSEGNQWYMNGVLIVGATKQNYTPSLNGKYSVRVTDQYGCTSNSAAFDYQLTSDVLSIVDEEFSCAPQPFSESLVLHFNTEFTGARIRLRDALGRLVYTSDELNYASGSVLRISDLAQYPNGLYLLTIHASGKVSYRWLIKNF